MIHSVTKGDPSHPAVICVHGLLGSSRNVLRLADKIANASYFCILYDQRGHGKSPHAKTYSLETMGHDLFTVMDTHQIPVAHLVGHSLGARVSIAASGQNQNRVRSLSLLDAGTLASDGAKKSVRGVVEQLPDSFSSKPEAEKTLSIFDSGMKAFLLSNLREKEGRMRWTFDLAGIRGGLLEALALDQTQVWKKISVPSLILRGSKSAHFAQSEVSLMLEQNRHARSQEIANAGHWLHVDNLEDTASAVINFLNAVEGRK